TATFVLATRTCQGNTDSAGAACSSAEECGGKAPRCEPSPGARAAFAADATRTTALFGGTGADIQLLGCRIEARQGEPFGRCGADRASSRACRSDADCGATGACKPGGGKPSGPGRVNVVDFRKVTNARIEGVVVAGHSDGDFTIATGSRGTVVGVSNLTIAAYRDTPRGAVDVGVLAGGGSAALSNRLRAARRTIDIKEGTVVNNWVEVACRAPGDTMPGTVIVAKGWDGEVAGNRITCDAPRPGPSFASYHTGIEIPGVQQVVDHNIIVGCFHGIVVASSVGNVTI